VASHKLFAELQRCTLALLSVDKPETARFGIQHEYLRLSLSVPHTLLVARPEGKVSLPRNMCTPPLDIRSNTYQRSPHHTYISDGKDALHLLKCCMNALVCCHITCTICLDKWQNKFEGNCKKEMRINQLMHSFTAAQPTDAGATASTNSCRSINFRLHTNIT
jgi:hypothetical protein